MPKDGAIPLDADSMPDEMQFDEAARRLLVGKGFIESVPAAVWNERNKLLFTQGQKFNRCGGMPFDHLQAKAATSR